MTNILFYSAFGITVKNATKIPFGLKISSAENAIVMQTFQNRMCCGCNDLQARPVLSHKLWKIFIYFKLLNGFLLQHINK